jgi:NADH:ubiquinone oxidoreductase subunit 4 (subunit M)
VAVLLLGVWPQPLIQMMEASVTQLLEHMALGKLG